MVFGRNMIPLDQVDIHAPRDSDAWYLALMGRQFPGSWLPLGQEQVVRCAQPSFRLVSSTNGRLDYIETISEWGKRTGARSLRKTLLKLRLVPRWLTSADFRLAFTSGVSANKVCFERELLDHYRLVFEKTGLGEARAGNRAQAAAADSIDMSMPMTFRRRCSALKANVFVFLHRVVEDRVAVRVGARRHEHPGGQRDQLGQALGDALLERRVLGLLAQEPGAVGDVAVLVLGDQLEALHPARQDSLRSM